MKTVLRAIRYFVEDELLIAALVVCIGISFGLALLYPWCTSMLIDLVALPEPRSDWMHRTFIAVLPGDASGRILALAVLTMVVLIGQHTTWFVGRIMLNKRIRYNGLARVRLDLYHKFQHLALDYHRNRPLGDTIYRLSTDTQGFFNILDTLIGAAVACVTVIILIGIMLLNSVPLTLLALAVVPPLVVVNVFFARIIRRRALIAKQADSDFTTTVQQSIGAIGLIQLFSRYEPDYERFEKSVRRANATNWRLNWVDDSLYPLSVQIIFAVGIMLIIAIGGQIAYRDTFVTHNPSGVTFGNLLVFIAYVAQLNDPLSRITGFKAAIQTNVAAADRVLVILDSPISVADTPEARPLPLQRRTLVIDKVSFHYPSVPNFQLPVVHGSGHPAPLQVTGEKSPQLPLVLQDVSCAISPGQFVAFVGASGAGKTTLFWLLPRFYDPTAGAIQLDDRDIRWVPLADLRKHIAMVQQDSPLFPGTVAENIAFGRPGASRKEIVEAARAAGAHAFISQMEEGYETLIAESSTNLSGGQRQRLALARALLAGAPILLLDEPTSAQDPHHASAIMETLRALRGDRTVLLVTHDLSLVEQADHVFVLEQGRVAEAGPPAELMARGGLFHALRMAQES